MRFIQLVVFMQVHVTYVVSPFLSGECYPCSLTAGIEKCDELFVSTHVEFFFIQNVFYVG